MRMGAKWLYSLAIVVMISACGSDEKSEDDECDIDADCADGICVDGECEDDDPSPNDPTGDGAYLDECEQDGDCESGVCITTDEGALCSVPCGGDGHCDEEPGWTCEELSADLDSPHCFPGANDICAPCSSDEDCAGDGAECLELDDNSFDLGSPGDGGQGGLRGASTDDRAPDGAPGIEQSTYEID